MADRITPEEAARLAHYLEPGTGHTLTPDRALRAVGLYLGDEDDAPRTPRSISAAELRDRMGLHKDAGRDAVAKYLDRERPVAVEQPKREWPGPWHQDSDGDWVRLWPGGDWYAVNGTAVLDRPHPSGDAGGPVIERLKFLANPANRRAADAILATICDGEDPHKGSGQYGEMDCGSTTTIVGRPGLHRVVVTDAHGRRSPVAEQAVKHPTPPAGYRIESGPHTPGEIEEGWDFFWPECRHHIGTFRDARPHSYYPDVPGVGGITPRGDVEWFSLASHSALYRLTPIAADPDPTTIDVSGTGLPGIVVVDGEWCWSNPNRVDTAVEFGADEWVVFRPGTSRPVAEGPETGPEARRLAFAALERYVASKRGR